MITAELRVAEVRQPQKRRHTLGGGVKLVHRLECLTKGLGRLVRGTYVSAAAQRQGFSCRRMVTGAGHDAQMMTRICPTGMIFVPSRAGLSHCPQEFTGPEDLRRGVLTLLETALDLLDAEDIGTK